EESVKIDQALCVSARIVRVLVNDLVSENASSSLRLAYRCGRRRRSRAEAFKNDDCTRGQSQQSDDDYAESFRSHPFTDFAVQSILRCRSVSAHLCQRPDAFPPIA